MEYQPTRYAAISCYVFPWVTYSIAMNPTRYGPDCTAMGYHIKATGLCSRRFFLMEWGNVIDWLLDTRPQTGYLYTYSKLRYLELSTTFRYVLHKWRLRIESNVLGGTLGMLRFPYMCMSEFFGSYSNSTESLAARVHTVLIELCCNRIEKALYRISNRMTCAVVWIITLYIRQNSPNNPALLNRVFLDRLAYDSVPQRLHRKNIYEAADEVPYTFQRQLNFAIAPRAVWPWFKMRIRGDNLFTPKIAYTHTFHATSTHTRSVWTLRFNPNPSSWFWVCHLFYT